MAKRDTETEKWKNPWFRKLSPKSKLLWLYLIENCDHAGFWKEDFALASFQIGFDLDQADLKDFLGKVIRIDEDTLFIRGFAAFQCGKLNPAVRYHQSVISRMLERGVDPVTFDCAHPLKLFPDPEPEPDRGRKSIPDPAPANCSVSVSEELANSEGREGKGKEVKGKGKETGTETNADSARASSETSPSPSPAACSSPGPEFDDDFDFNGPDRIAATQLDARTPKPEPPARKPATVSPIRPLTEPMTQRPDPPPVVVRVNPPESWSGMPDWFPRPGRALPDPDPEPEWGMTEVRYAERGVAA